MKPLLAVFCFVMTIVAGQAAIAQNAFVQMEAHPSLQTAQDRARTYSGNFTDVNGFSIGNGWYALALGPYTQADAAQRLRTLKQQRLIPQDSYVAFAPSFGQQFWPVGANTLNSQPTTPETSTEAEAETETAAAPETPPEPVVDPDETPRQARQSESRLSREDRQLLQTALQWEGFYNSAIDGAIGPGTRAAMSAWQDANGFEVTGILTSNQRYKLISDYNAVLDGLGLTTLVSNDAGLSLRIPGALVEFDRMEPPFIHYRAKTDEEVKLLLISQTGTQSTLHGLYDIMQTLEIVPLEGEREKRENSFTLTGQNADIHSYTYAKLDGGFVKGFTLIWPAGDEKRMNRVIQDMQESFSVMDGVGLDDLVGEPDDDQRIDLLAGLEIRAPDVSRSGFFIDGTGTVLTTSEVIGQCSEITLNRDQTAEVVLSDADLGIAVLRPTEALSPIAHAEFRPGVARIKSEVAAAGFPYEGVLDAATLTFGELSDIRGLRGETELQRLTMRTESGNAGGPVFDRGGAVIGVLLPNQSPEGQQLPADVNFSAKSAAIAELLAANGVNITNRETNSEIPPERLTELAMDMTVLVSCWN